MNVHLRIVAEIFLGDLKICFLSTWVEQPCHIYESNLILTWW